MNAGTTGVSGELTFSTGTSSSGSSGSISIGTGSASGGKGGDITIKVGDGNTLDGGHLSLFAGNTYGDISATGGSISIRSGYSSIRSSGSIFLRTLNAGTTGVSGELVFKTGTSSSGSSGSINIETGSATGGESGSISVKVGTATNRGKVLISGNVVIDGALTVGTTSCCSSSGRRLNTDSDAQSLKIRGLKMEIRSLKHDLVLELEKVEENLNKLRLENVELRMLNHYWAMLAFAGFIAIVILICVVATRMFTHVSEENEKSNIQKISKLISQKADAV